MVEKNKNSWLKYMTWGSTLASTLAGLAAGGYFLGNYLDARWATDPWLKIIFILLGVGLGIAYLIFSLNKLGKTDE